MWADDKIFTWRKAAMHLDYVGGYYPDQSPDRRFGCFLFGKIPLDELSKKKIIIWGAGKTAKETFGCLSHKGLDFRRERHQYLTPDIDIKFNRVNRPGIRGIRANFPGTDCRIL